MGAGAGLAGGAGLVAGLDSAGAGLLSVFFGAPVVGNVGMVCLRFGAASGRTKGPFCPQASKVPAKYTINPVFTKHFITLSITLRARGFGWNFCRQCPVLEHQ